MPFDPLPAAAPIIRRPELRPVALWLFVLCAMILVMVALGGATRLTGSGLSIMEWAPLLGALPPLSETEWQRLYALYQQIPQYDLVNHGFGIEGFKSIFWLEWVHRLWGRLMGAALLLPLIWFAVCGRVGRGLGLRLFGLLVLGALQGAVGWFMVASGFEADSTSVSAYRLVAHLALALLLYAAILWTALGVLHPLPAGTRRGGAFARLLGVAAVLLPLTILAGGFTAGLHAGLIYNTFPLMGGSLVPTDYARLQPFLRNLTENVAAVQFDHRLLATLTALAVTAAAWFGVQPSQARRVRIAAGCMAAAVALQYGLGVATLLWVVPVPLAVAHQAVAVLLLTATLVTLHLRLRTA